VRDDAIAAGPAKRRWLKRGLVVIGFCEMIIAITPIPTCKAFE
jgi:hypothetical protein